MIRTNPEIVTSEPSIDGRFTRAQLLKAAGLGLALAALPGAAAAQSAAGAGSAALSFPYFPQVAGSYTPEEIRDMFNMLVTIERFVVANVTASLQGTIAPGLAPLHIPIEQSSVVTALAHVSFWSRLAHRV